MKTPVIEILKKVNVIITGTHVVLTSGRHSSAYINKDALYPHTHETAKVGKMFAEKFKNKNIDVVVAPAVGGTILCQWTAYYLSKLKKKEIFSVYTEKNKGTSASASESEQIFRRGYDKYVKGKKALIVEDLTTTGISVKKVADAIKTNGGKVAAICVMVNRDPKLVTSKTVGAPFSSLGVFIMDSYNEKDCPHCKKNIPINTSVGHGRQYLEGKKDKN